MKYFLSIFLSVLALTPLLVPFGAKAAEEISFSLIVDGCDTTVTASTVVVYPNETDAPRVISASTYNFRNAYLLIFNREGKLIEAGENLLANEDGTNGSPQTSVTVPTGGFLVAFGTGASADLRQCYDTAFEGAVLYNATMSILYDVNGTYDPATGKLSVSYLAPEPKSADAVTFLFVGNSTTYFNGTPIKFRGLCRDAGVDVDVLYCTFGSAYLSQFADETHEYGKALRQKLAENKVDYVVLQDAGTAAPGATGAAVDTLVPLIRDSGAEPVLYMRYSTDTSVDGRRANAARHYATYTTIGEKYGLKVAPAAIAFLYCLEDGVDVDLYADDRSHHSAAGSYLIACTWLRSFLGISPVGNGYTANLDEDTVRTLQEIALRSCDTPFEYEGGQPDGFVDGDGTEYPNVTVGRPYTVVGDVYSGAWTDSAENGSPLGKFTDGYAVHNGGDALLQGQSGRGDHRFGRTRRAQTRGNRPVRERRLGDRRSVESEGALPGFRGRKDVRSVRRSNRRGRKRRGRMAADAVHPYRRKRGECRVRQGRISN